MFQAGELAHRADGRFLSAFLDRTGRESEVVQDQDLLDAFQRNAKGGQLGRLSFHLDFAFPSARYVYRCYPSDGLKAWLDLVPGHLGQRVLTQWPAYDDLHNGDGVDIGLDDRRIKRLAGQLAADGRHLAFHVYGCLVPVHAFLKGDYDKAHPL